MGRSAANRPFGARQGWLIYVSDPATRDWLSSVAIERSDRVALHFCIDSLEAFQEVTRDGATHFDLLISDRLIAEGPAQAAIRDFMRASQHCQILVLTEPNVRSLGPILEGWIDPSPQA